MSHRPMSLAMIVASLALTEPAAAQSDTEHSLGVELTGMWEYLGANSYTNCFLKEVGPVSEDATLMDARLEHAEAACGEAVAEAFASTTMNGGSFPAAFVEEAQSVVPDVRAYIAAYVQALPPSGTPLSDRLGIFYVGRDGTARELGGGRNVRLGESEIFELRATETPRTKGGPGSTSLVSVGGDSDLPAENSVVTRSLSLTKTLNVPQEISAALYPYMACLLEANGTTLTVGSERLRAPDPDDVGCVKTRVKARTRSLALLQANGDRRSATERERFVDESMASIAAFVEPPSDAAITAEIED